MDRRESAYDPFYGSFDEKTMTGWLYGKDEGVPIRCHFEICETCNGTGKHVNPSIDSNGITQSEMDELGDDFREDYMSGVYDVTCAECGGKRVVPIPNQDDPNVAAYDDAIGDHYDHIAEMEAERRIGA